MNDTAARGADSRAVYIRLLNEELEALFERLRAAGMPNVGICGCLASHYAYLARETGATEEHAREIAINAVRRAFEQSEGPS